MENDAEEQAPAVYRIRAAAESHVQHVLFTDRPELEHVVFFCLRMDRGLLPSPEVTIQAEDGLNWVDIVHIQYSEDGSDIVTITAQEEFQGPIQAALARRYGITLNLEERR